MIDSCQCNNIGIRLNSTIFSPWCKPVRAHGNDDGRKDGTGNSRHPMQVVHAARVVQAAVLEPGLERFLLWLLSRRRCQLCGIRGFIDHRRLDYVWLQAGCIRSHPS